MCALPGQVHCFVAACMHVSTFVEAGAIWTCWQPVQQILDTLGILQVPWLRIHPHRLPFSAPILSAIATFSYSHPHSYAALITFFFLKDCLIFWYLGNQCYVAKSCVSSFAKTYLWWVTERACPLREVCKLQWKNQKHHKCHAFWTMALAQQINHAKELLQCHVQKLWSVPGRANDLRAATQQLPSITQRNWTCRAGCQC